MCSLPEIFCPHIVDICIVKLEYKSTRAHAKLIYSLFKVCKKIGYRYAIKRQTVNSDDVTKKQRPGPCATITHRRVRPLASASRTETCLNAGERLEKELGEMLTLTQEDKQVQKRSLPCTRYPSVTLRYCVVV